MRMAITMETTKVLDDDDGCPLGTMFAVEIAGSTCDDAGAGNHQSRSLRSSRIVLLAQSI